ncbi:hypothetical protein IWQ57_005435, partial [Coemansia nantahalensis]
MRRVFRHLVDFPSFEWFEDLGRLGTWGSWVVILQPLLSVCRYWRGLACPLYYQYAAGCYGNKGYRSVRRARLKARIDEVVAPHLRAMVRHVYLNFSIDSLLGEGSQRTLDRALGDAVFPGAQQLVIEVDEEMGAVDEEL